MKKIRVLTATRYVIKLKNGSYMAQEFSDTQTGVINVFARDPIDSDLFKDREAAERYMKDVLTGKTEYTVLYDVSNPPEEVIEVEVTADIKY